MFQPCKLHGGYAWGWIISTTNPPSPLEGGGGGGSPGSPETNWAQVDDRRVLCPVIRRYATLQCAGNSRSEMCATTHCKLNLC